LVTEAELLWPAEEVDMVWQPVKVTRLPATKMNAIKVLFFMSLDPGHGLLPRAV
jgi:hypothetical protein